MRFLFGIIVGIGLTIGGAYLHDHSQTAGATQRPLVNWDVASDRASGVRHQIDAATSWLRGAWQRHVAG